MIAALLTLVWMAQTPGVLVDGVAALVEREVITRSDVDRAARLQLARRGAGMAAARAPLDDRLRGAVLNMLIVEELITLDCRRRQRFPETDEQVLQQVALTRNMFPNDDAFQDFLKTLQMPENDLMDLARREVRVDLVLADAMAGAPPSDAELDEAAKTDGELRALIASAGRERARVRLHDDRRGQRAFQYVERLRKGTSVKVVAVYASPEPGRADARAVAKEPAR